MATATKASLENKHLGNGDYIVIIASSSHPLLLREHAANGLVEAPLKFIYRMKDLLLCVHVVKTLNLKISRCHFNNNNNSELYLHDYNNTKAKCKSVESIIIIITVI